MVIVVAAGCQAPTSQFENGHVPPTFQSSWNYGQRHGRLADLKLRPRYAWPNVNPARSGGSSRRGP